MTNDINIQYIKDIEAIRRSLDSLVAGQTRNEADHIDLKSDITFLKKKMLDPDDGAIARTNKNTEFRLKAQKIIGGIITSLILLATKDFWLRVFH